MTKSHHSFDGCDPHEKEHYAALHATLTPPKADPTVWPEPTLLEKPAGANRVVSQKFKKTAKYAKPQAVSETDRTLAGIHKRVMLGTATGEDAQALMLAIDDIKRLVAEDSFDASDAARHVEVVPASDITQILSKIGSTRDDH
jgi:hypothetical protein